MCSKALKFISSKSRELSLLIVKMVVEGFGLPKQYSLDVEELNSYNGIRMTKYGVFEDTKNDDVGLIPHTDRGTIALICDNEVQGLQLLLKTNKWVDINIPPNGFVVLVGDILQVIYTCIKNIPSFGIIVFLSFFFIRL
jgi:isopenicillin N synthase-like dioxygenase